VERGALEELFHSEAAVHSQAVRNMAAAKAFARANPEGV